MCVCVIRFLSMPTTDIATIAVLAAFTLMATFTLLNSNAIEEVCKLDCYRNQRLLIHYFQKFNITNEGKKIKKKRIAKVHNI